jgi:sulfur-oxidizing protein SoxX
MQMKRVIFIELLIFLVFRVAHAQTLPADGVSQPLTDSPGDPIRGKAIVMSRQTGLCLLCHGGPFPEERFQGNLAPDLAMSSAHLSIPQLRARIMDPSRFHPNTIMPSYYRDDHLYRVAPKFIGQTILSGQEIEDVIAFLASLKNLN